MDNVIKPRTVPIHLKIRRLLLPRMTFTDGELKQLQWDEKGFQGECYFDQLITDSPASTYLQLRDLMLKWQGTTFQIDSVLIGPHKIYLSDVKNFGGEYYIEGERWFSISGYEVKNHLHQLRRSEAHFRSLAQSIGLNLPIEANAVFVNPEFTLFNANKNLPIILPTQINSYIRRLGSVTIDQPLIEAAKKLASLHEENSPYLRNNIPKYTYESLKKGSSCANCNLLSVQLVGQKFECLRCGLQENLAKGILRSVEELQLLFPDRPITVANIMDWWDLKIDRKRIQRVLRKHLQMVHRSVSTYYK